MGKYSKMSTFAGAILGLLGLKEWKKAEDKDILDADDVAKLKELGFDEKFITPFGEALKMVLRMRNSRPVLLRTRERH